MLTYKIKLNDYQMNTLNLIENKNIRESLMSILSYTLKLNYEKTKLYKEYEFDFLKKEPNELKLSFQSFHTRYNTKYHKKLSLQTLKNRIEQLIDLKLLVVLRKEKKTNVYGFILEKINGLSNNLSENMSEINCAETVNSTVIEDNSNIEQILNSKTKNNINTKSINIKTKDLDSNEPNEFDYDEYLDSERKVCDWNIVCTKANELFKALKVRSSRIKECVIAKLSKYYHTITTKHLESYITKMIINAREQSHSNWEQSRNKIAQAPALSFCNFEGRQYDYAHLEKMALGEMNYDTRALYK